MQAVDWNGDGKTDLLAGAGLAGAPTRSEYAKIKLYTNIGTTSAPKFSASFVKNLDGTDYYASTDHEPKTFAVDWNQDGRLDLIDVQPHGLLENQHDVYWVNGTDLQTMLNLAASATITVDSESGAYTKDKAIDENASDFTSRWLSTSATSTHYYQLDWASNKSINRVLVWSGGGMGSSTGFQIDDYEMQYWNGSNWVNISGAGITNNTQDGALGDFNDLSFSAVTTSRIRMNITDPSHSTDNTARLLEIKVYGN